MQCRAAQLSSTHTIAQGCKEEVKFMPPKIPEEQLITFFRDEYLLLQNQYEDYDKRSLAIKGWVTSGVVTALALSLNAQFPTSLFIALIVAFVILIAWYTETYWKLFQYGFADRIRIIEAYFRGEEDILIKDLKPFQIYHWWFKSYVADEPIYSYESLPGKKQRSRSVFRRFWIVAFKQFVFLPYLPLLFLCIVCVVYVIFRP
jgi:hypothetical protein